jgi:hypothetical protein
MVGLCSSSLKGERREIFVLFVAPNPAPSALSFPTAPGIFAAKPAMAIGGQFQVRPLSCSVACFGLVNTCRPNIGKCPPVKEDRKSPGYGQSDTK